MSEAAGHRVYLVLGSNIEPEANLLRAVEMLGAYGDLAAVSRVWESPPADGPDQPNYLNAAILLETRLSAEELQREMIPAIERKLGRVRDPQDKNAPRTIDVDLALFDDAVLAVDHRRIPDPDILRRPFVAVPLAEIDPGYVHPQNGRTLHEIAGTLAAEGPPMHLRSDIDLHDRAGGSLRSAPGTSPPSS